MKKFYIFSNKADDEYNAIFELTEEEAEGVRKVIKGTPLAEYGGGYVGVLSLSEGYDTLEEAEKDIYDGEEDALQKEI